MPASPWGVKYPKVKAILLTLIQDGSETLLGDSRKSKFPLERGFNHRSNNYCSSKKLEKRKWVSTKIYF